MAQTWLADASAKGMYLSTKCTALSSLFDLRPFIQGISAILPSVVRFPTNHRAIAQLLSLFRANTRPTMARSATLHSAVVTITILLAILTSAVAFNEINLGSLEDHALTEFDLKMREPDLLVGPQVETVVEELEEAPPHTHRHEKRYGSGTPYWVSQIKRQGKTPYGNQTNFVIWRNVKDYGAKETA